MTLNPYESPQTTNQPLPMAAEVVEMLPQHAILAIATGHCASAGRLYLIGCGIAWLLIGLILFQSGTDRGSEDFVWVIIPGVFLAVTSAVFFAWGFLLALVGYLQLRVRPHEPRLRRLYALAVLQIWLRALLLVVWLFMPDHYFPLWQYWDEIRLLPPLGLSLSFLHTCYLQTQALVLLAKLGTAPPPRAWLALYLFSGLLIFAGSLATMYVLKLPYGSAWLVTTGSLVTLHLAGYRASYKSVQRNFHSMVALA